MMLKTNKKQGIFGALVLVLILLLISPVNSTYFEVEKPVECEEGNIWCGWSGLKQVIKECKSGKEIVKETCSDVCTYKSTGEPHCVVVVNRIVTNPPYFLYLLILILLILLVYFIIKSTRKNGNFK